MGSEPRQLHLFFFPLMAHGHTIPMIDIARLFAARGIKSTIITTPLNAVHFSESIVGDKQSGLDIGVEIIPFPCVEAGLPEGCENFNSLTSKEMLYPFFQALSKFQQPFERLLEEFRPDCVVCDALFTWTTELAYKHGIPRLLFHGTSNFTLCVMENIKRYTPQEKVTTDSTVFVVPGLPDQIEITRLQLHNHGNTGRNAFSDFREKLQETEVKSFGILVNSFYELEPGYAEYHKRVMGRRTWNIGPVSLYNSSFTNKSQRGKKASIDGHRCLSWLDSKEPNSVLYVSFGSISCFSSAQILEIAMGLEASHVSFIWVVRVGKIKGTDQFLPEGFEERMEGKGLIIRDWAPQVLILDHPAVGGFMTHCGWNSTLEGITAGVPLITWPLFAEQFINEKLVTQVNKTGIKAGHEVWSSWVEIEHVSVTKDRVEEVATQLMGNGEAARDLRRQARELGEKAKMAVEEEGSSHNDLTAVIEELRMYSHPTMKVIDKEEDDRDEL